MVVFRKLYKVRKTMEFLYVGKSCKNMSHKHTQAVVISCRHCLMFSRIGFHSLNAVMELTDVFEVIACNWTSGWTSRIARLSAVGGHRPAHCALPSLVKGREAPTHRCPHGDVNVVAAALDSRLTTRAVRTADQYAEDCDPHKDRWNADSVCFETC